jgi:hypothetical protein
VDGVPSGDVEWLCWQEKPPFPARTSKKEYLLRDLWLLSPDGGRAPGSSRRRRPRIKVRNIFGGDHRLDRV